LKQVLLAGGLMTAAVDRLESKGFLVRKNVPNDRRAKVLELTGEGKRVVETVCRTHAAELEAIMGPFLKQNEKRQLFPASQEIGTLCGFIPAKNM
jgi:DNA-binding MarR family transcriptional regulator